MIYVGRFKEYILRKKKEEQTKLITIVDVLWRIMLPIVFGLLVFIFPAQVIYFFAGKEHAMKNIGMVYLLGFIISFFIFSFILIKLGKIKIARKWPPD